MLNEIDSGEFLTRLKMYFNMEATAGQLKLFEKLSTFITSSGPRDIFVLKGYAGTGKTTVVSCIIRSLASYRTATVLIAPTGRAAKVLASYSNKPAFTIHKKIYKTIRAKNGNIQFTLEQNLHKNTLFIADEASMIGDSRNRAEQGGFDNRKLLEDLITFVQNGHNCRLMLIGDTAQLPPVGSPESPALQDHYLKSSFPVEPASFELTEVVRQAQDSGILYNATSIRELIRSGSMNHPTIRLNGFKDIERVSGNDLADALQYCYGKYGDDNTMVICRSNKRANIYNQEIRSRIKFHTDSINTGDYVMVVKNNYHWLQGNEITDFIANGDIAEVTRIKKRGIEKYGFQFTQASIRLTDYPELKEFDVILLMNTILSESPSLSYDENNRLFKEIYNDYLPVKNSYSRLMKVKSDPFFNALQIKFAYAITCHKAQGGQWPVVFIEQGYLTPDKINQEFNRWLYTSFTRSVEKIYLINFSDQLIEQ